MSGTLYIVATPIGNLEDITYRAVNILKSVDIIACEDTRRTRILTDRYGISKPMVSFYSYNEVRKCSYLTNELLSGKNIALVSEAGTPGLSDPGHSIIKAAIEKNIPLDSIPGPTALIDALVLSGKPMNKFIFEGFLSNKSSQRKKRLGQLKGDTRTVILYESPHRILKLLNDILEVMGDVQVVCARELTKKFQEINRDKVSGIIAHYVKNGVKGEFVVII